jgi:hypothetical protein
MDALPDDFPRERVIQQMLDIFVEPEVERRVASGDAAKPFRLTAFQVVMRDDQPPHVRLNGEVKALARIRLAEPREDLAVGDDLYESDLTGEIETIELAPEEDPDCAHATCIIINGVMRFAFDFRYNKALAVKHLRTAREFLDTAADCETKGRDAPFVDSLLSAAELIARATLITMPDRKFRKKASHKEIQQKHATFVESGNADPAHADVYGELRQVRDALRYVTAARTIAPEDAQRYLETVEDMYADAERRLA